MSNLIFSQVFIHYFSQKSRTTTKVFSSEPPFNIYETKGRIFGIIEINTPNRENSKIISQLIDFIEHYYYSTPPELSVLESFEQALQNANKEFEEIVTASGTMLMGTLTLATLKEKINLVVGVVFNNEIHICTLNHMGAFLIYRTNQEFKTISIAHNEQGANGDLFSTVISGECIPGNYLFFCNTQFTQHISQERFTKTITSLSPSKAADYFKNSLIGYDGFNFAGIIIQNQKVVTSSKINPTSLSTINDLNQQEAATEKLLSTSLFPQFNYGMTTSIKEKFMSLIKKSTPHGVVETKTVSQTILQPDLVRHDSSPAKSFGAKLSTASREFKNSQFAINTSLKTKRLKSYLTQSINNLPSLTKLLTVLFCVILLFFGYSLYRSNPQAISNVISQFTENKELSTLEQEIAEAQAKVISGDLEAAKPMLASIETKLPTLKINNNNDQSRLNDLNETLNVLIAQIRKITIVNDPMALATLPITGEEKASHITHFGNTILAIVDTNNTAQSYNTLTKTLTPIQGSWESGITSATTLDGKITLLDTQNKLHTLTDTNTFNVSTITTQNPIVDITSYNDRLYTLTPANNQLNRHSLVDSTYQSGITWIQESGINLTGAIAVSLDTRVWIAFNNGTVQKFFKGFKQAFSLQQIEPTLTSVNDFIKPESSKFLYLLDSQQKRVVVFNDEGMLITQYYSPSLSSIDAMSVDETAKTLYITSGNQLMAIFMQHL